MECFATIIFDRADIEIHDLQCQNGWTWQLLTCCDTLVGSLVDNLTVLHNKHKLTAGHIHAHYPLFSHVKRTCMQEHDACSCI